MFRRARVHSSPICLWVVNVGLTNFFFRAEDGIRDTSVTGVQTCALPISPPTISVLHESYMHDAPDSPPDPRPASRRSLSWWSLLEMVPDLPPADEPWSPKSVLLESQGLAVLRSGDRYVSLESGPQGGGHGHPDRLQLTLHGDGVYWLPDPGTGQYVTHDLFWYRSTLAHNAPLLDGESQPSGRASVECFDDRTEWGWVRGRFNGLTRMIAAGPAYIVDVLVFGGTDEHVRSEERR